VIFGTLSSLESLVRTAAQLPERKLVVFVSDGFFINFVSSTQVYDLRRLTDAAMRTGTVIYTIDARGLTSGITDATKSGLFDQSGRLARINLAEGRTAQQPLYNLAAETGGQAWLNSNNLDGGVALAMNEIHENRQARISGLCLQRRRFGSSSKNPLAGRVAARWSNARSDSGESRSDGWRNGPGTHPSCWRVSAGRFSARAI
jgi:hypothetical protein